MKPFDKSVGYESLPLVRTKDFIKHIASLLEKSNMDPKERSEFISIMMKKEKEIDEIEDEILEFMVRKNSSQIEFCANMICQGKKSGISTKFQLDYYAKKEERSITKNFVKILQGEQFLINCVTRFMETIPNFRDMIACRPRFFTEGFKVRE